MPPQNDLKIFISHSSADAEIARALIDLLQPLGVLPSQIRCTSLPGYKLGSGEDTLNELRQQVQDAKVVIGLVSPNSLTSQFVLFELGVRWGTGKFCVLLLAGVRPEDLIPPLNLKNPRSTDNSDDIHQFIHDVAKQLDVERQNPASFTRHISTLRTLTRRGTATRLAKRFIPFIAIFVLAAVGIVVVAQTFQKKESESPLYFSHPGPNIVFRSSTRITMPKSLGDNCPLYDGPQDNVEPWYREKLQDFLQRSGGQSTKEISWFRKRDEEKLLLEANLVILGGPVRNCAFVAVRKILKSKLGLNTLPFDFSDEVYDKPDDRLNAAIVVRYDDTENVDLNQMKAQYLHKKNDGEAWYFRSVALNPKSPKDTDFDPDYSLFILGPNPFDQTGHHELILVSGNHSEGTDGLGYILDLSKEKVEALRRIAAHSPGVNRGYLFGILKIPHDKKFHPKLVRLVSF